MNILIIGGTGLISTGITRQLLDKGHQVTHYNRGQTEDRNGDGRVKKITGDRKDSAQFESQMKEAGPFDCVIDVYCFTGLEAESAVRAFRGRIGQYIQCSTIDVYQRPADRYPLLENERQKVNNAYGAGKIDCERVFLEAHRRGDFPVTILRPSFTYGEGRRFVSATGWGTEFLDRLRKGKPVIAFGDGSCLLAPCHRDDVARAFVNAVANQKTHGKCYHVPSPEAHTWNQYYEIIAEALDAPKPKIVHIPTDILYKVVPEEFGMLILTNFQFNTVYDISAAKADLDFQYTIPFRVGARRVVNWLKEHNMIEDCEKHPLVDQILSRWEKATSQFLKEFGVS